MKFLVALGTFIAAWAVGGNFLGGLMVGVGIWLVLRINERVGALEHQVAALRELLEPRAEPAPATVQAAPSVTVELPAKVSEPEPEPEPAPTLQPAFSKPEPLPPYSAEPPPTEQGEEPSLVARLVSGNLVAIVGAIVLFFGVGFLLKLAYDRGMFPPELRLAGVALSAVGVFIAGWRLRETRRLYGLILQGVASGLAYLTVYFALKTYGFIGVTAGFTLFALLGVATTMLAVRQDAKTMAVLGLTGAFMAPVLASTGQGNHVVLFSYYLLLNAFILAVSWFKAWRMLNLMGWLFTFGIAALWGSKSYTPALFGTVEPFLLAYFAMYLVIPILFATRQPPELKGLVDGTLVFGTPAAVAVMQARLVWDLPYGLAYSSATGAALYALLALMALREKNMRFLGATYVALAVGLGTLAIAFAFGAYTTFALWTIEGTALLWVCLRQKQLLGRVSALLVQAAGAVQFFVDYGSYQRPNPWFNDAVLGCAIIAVASFLSAALYRRYEDRIGETEKQVPGFILWWGALCYTMGAIDAIHHGISDPADKLAAALLFFSASAVVAELAGARVLTLVHPLVIAAGAFYQLSQFGHPLGGLGGLAWPAAFGSAFWILHRQRRDGFAAALELRYAGLWLVLAGLATWEAGWWLYKREYLVCMAIALVGYVAGAVRYRLRELGKPASTVLSTLTLMWAMLFWFAAGFAWIHRALDTDQEVRAALLLVSGSALMYAAVHQLAAWPALRSAARLPWIAIPVAIAAELVTGESGHPFSNWLGLAWPAAWGLAIATLRREEENGPQHFVALYAPIVLSTWELLWWLDRWQFGSAWQSAALAVPGAVALIFLTGMRNRLNWPLYQSLLALIVAGLLAWSLYVNLLPPGDLAPLGFYAPLFNPTDVALVLAAIAVVAWTRTLEDREKRDSLGYGLALMGFLWLNASALRTIHYWEGVPYRLADMMASVQVQAVFSILWTSAALALMLLSRVRMARPLWAAGAILLAVVVAKLFLVDLANSGTVARIVSFVGVGVLLLVIGYVAPVPPAEKHAENQSAG